MIMTEMVDHDADSLEIKIMMTLTILIKMMIYANNDNNADYQCHDDRILTMHSQLECLADYCTFLKHIDGIANASYSLQRILPN